MATAQASRSACPVCTGEIQSSGPDAQPAFRTHLQTCVPGLYQRYGQYLNTIPSFDELHKYVASLVAQSVIPRTSPGQPTRLAPPQPTPHQYPPQQPPQPPQTGYGPQQPPQQYPYYAYGGYAYPPYQYPPQSAPQQAPPPLPPGSSTTDQSAYYPPNYPPPPPGATGAYPPHPHPHAHAQAYGGYPPHPYGHYAYQYHHPQGGHPPQPPPPGTTPMEVSSTNTPSNVAAAPPKKKRGRPPKKKQAAAAAAAAAAATAARQVPSPPKQPELEDFMPSKKKRPLPPKETDTTVQPPPRKKRKLLYHNTSDVKPPKRCNNDATISVENLRHMIRTERRLYNAVTYADFATETESSDETRRSKPSVDHHSAIISSQRALDRYLLQSELLQQCFNGKYLDLLDRQHSTRADANGATIRFWIESELQSLQSSFPTIEVGTSIQPHNTTDNAELQSAKQRLEKLKKFRKVWNEIEKCPLEYELDSLLTRTDVCGSLATKVNKKENPSLSTDAGATANNAAVTESDDGLYDTSFGYSNGNNIRSVPYTVDIFRNLKNKKFTQL